MPRSWGCHKRADGTVLVPKCLCHPEEWIWVWKEKGVVEKGEPKKCRSPEAGMGEEVVKNPARSCREEAGWAGGSFYSRKSPGPSLVSCHSQGLAQSRHARKAASVDSVDDHKVCGPPNNHHQHDCLPDFLSLLTLSGRQRLLSPFTDAKLRHSDWLRT